MLNTSINIHGTTYTVTDQGLFRSKNPFAVPERVRLCAVPLDKYNGSSFCLFDMDNLLNDLTKFLAGTTTVSGPTAEKIIATLFPKPKVKKGHQHAELMLAFAKESLTDAEAYRNWQFFREDTGTWAHVQNTPLWDEKTKYRRRPMGFVEAYNLHKEGKPVKRGGLIHSFLRISEIDVSSTEWMLA